MVGSMFDPIEKLEAFVRCPSVSTDKNYAAGMGQARDFVASLMEEIGLRPEIVDTALHPVVFGRRDGPENWPLILLYGHYDVQPPDPLDLWETEPFDPQRRDGRLYGRGAADNKGPLLAHLSAIGQLLEEHPDLPLRFAVVVEGEEEIGSPNLLPFLEARRDELSRADFALLSDTGSPSEEQIVVTVGLRGIVALEVELTGPKGDLHSGIHGGAASNPAQALCEALASLRDADNAVAIPGFYDDVVEVEDWERAELAKLGIDEADYAKFLGVDALRPRKGYTAFEATRFQPTVEINGMGSGYQGQGTKTIIPSKAFAKLTCRLVANQSARSIGQLVKTAIEERLPPGVRARIWMGHEGDPYLVTPPGRPNTPPDQPPRLAQAFAAVDRAVTRVFGRPPLYLREGGSVPVIASIKACLGVDSLMIGLFLPEDNLHAPNESMRLSVFQKGLETSKETLLAVASHG